MFVSVESIELTSDVEAIDEDNPTAFITATVLPADATIPTLKWTITEGAGLVIWNRSNILELGPEEKYGQVTIKATATDGSGVFGTLSLKVGTPPIVTDLTDPIDTNNDYSRIILWNGTMLIEINRAGVHTWYDMTGRPVNKK